MSKPLFRDQVVHGLFAQYQAQHEITWIKVRGSSMLPLLNEQSWVLVAFGELPIKRGEIIVFDQGTHLIAHRVVAWRGDAIMAKGDSELYCDALIAPQHVLGVVRAMRFRANARASSFACDGFAAEWCGLWSGLLGRMAGLVRRVALRFPFPAQRVVLNASTALLRVASRAIFAPVAWFAHR